MLSRLPHLAMRHEPVSEQGVSPKLPSAWLPLLGVIPVLLLSPAIVNGLPLMFPDSGTYLGVAWGQLWPVDRSGLYGLFLRLFSALPPWTGLWSMALTQALIITLILQAAIRAIVPRARASTTLLLMVLMVMVTSLAWHASQIMPDAFTGPLVLLTWLAASRPAAAKGTALLWAACATLAVMHLTHVGLFAAAGSATLLVHWWSGLARRELVTRALNLVCWTALILMIPAVPNGLQNRGWTPFPASPVLLFARLNEDGLMQPWMNAHCPRGEVPALCRMYPDLPRDSQQLLWSPSSPFHRTLWPDLALRNNRTLVDQLQTANLGAIRHNPFRFAQTSSAGAWRQFWTFQPIDDECPSVCLSAHSALMGTFARYQPSLLPELVTTPQLRGQLPKKEVRVLSSR